MKTDDSCAAQMPAFYYSKDVDMKLCQESRVLTNRLSLDAYDPSSIPTTSHHSYSSMNNISSAMKSNAIPSLPSPNQGKIQMLQMKTSKLPLKDTSLYGKVPDRIYIKKHVPRSPVEKSSSSAFRNVSPSKKLTLIRSPIEKIIKNISSFNKSDSTLLSISDDGRGENVEPINNIFDTNDISDSRFCKSSGTSNSVENSFAPRIKKDFGEKSSKIVSPPCSSSYNTTVDVDKNKEFIPQENINGIFVRNNQSCSKNVTENSLPTTYHHLNRVESPSFLGFDNEADTHGNKVLKLETISPDKSSNSSFSYKHSSCVRNEDITRNSTITHSFGYNDRIPLINYLEKDNIICLNDNKSDFDGFNSKEKFKSNIVFDKGSEFDFTGFPDFDHIPPHSIKSNIGKKCEIPYNPILASDEICKRVRRSSLKKPSTPNFSAGK